MNNCKMFISILFLDIYYNIFYPNLVTAQNSIVDAVGCQFDRMNISLDTTAPALSDIFTGRNQVNEATLSINNKSDDLCQFDIKNMQDNFFSIPINPNHCSITVLNLEPEFTAVQARIQIRPKNSNTTVQSLVYCLFSSIVSGSIGGNNPRPLTVNNSVVHGGISGNKPNIQLTLELYSQGGEVTSDAYLGQQLYFNVSVEGGTYEAIQPLSCVFSPFENISNETVLLAFVEGGCPLRQMRDLITPMERINDVHFSNNFKAFRFHSGTTLYIHCTVKLCVLKQNCQKVK